MSKTFVQRHIEMIVAESVIAEHYEHRGSVSYPLSMLTQHALYTSVDGSTLVATAIKSVIDERMVIIVREDMTQGLGGIDTPLGTTFSQTVSMNDTGERIAFAFNDVQVIVYAKAQFKGDEGIYTARYVVNVANIIGGIGGNGPYVYIQELKLSCTGNYLAVLSRETKKNQYFLTVFKFSADKVEFQTVELLSAVYKVEDLTAHTIGELLNYTGNAGDEVIRSECFLVKYSTEVGDKLSTTINTTFMDGDWVEIVV